MVSWSATARERTLEAWRSWLRLPRVPRLHVVGARMARRRRGRCGRAGPRRHVDRGRRRLRGVARGRRRGARRDRRRPRAACTHRGVVYAGTWRRLLRLRDGALVAVAGFDDAPNRDEWHPVGRSLHVRSMTTPPTTALLANVHVGASCGRPTVAIRGDPRSVSRRRRPRGASAPHRPGGDVAAASVGLCTSDDGGATDNGDRGPLRDVRAGRRAHGRHGPRERVRRSVRRAVQRVRRSITGGEPARGGGLPTNGLAGNVDTGCLATGRGQAAPRRRRRRRVGGARDVTDWTRLAEAVGRVHAVAVA